MDVVNVSNNSLVNDMTALMSGFINNMDKEIKTRNSQSLHAY